MAPDQIKGRVQQAYTKALENRALQQYRSSNIDQIFHGMRLYGADAGADFVRTHLADIVREAVEAAECKQASLTIHIHRSGKAALEGMAQTLRDLTALKVSLNGPALTLTWAEPHPGLI